MIFWVELKPCDRFASNPIHQWSSSLKTSVCSGYTIVDGCELISCRHPLPVWTDPPVHLTPSCPSSGYYTALFPQLPDSGSPFSDVSHVYQRTGSPWRRTVFAWGLQMFWRRGKPSKHWVWPGRISSCQRYLFPHFTAALFRRITLSQHALEASVSTVPCHCPVPSILYVLLKVLPSTGPWSAPWLRS